MLTQINFYIDLLTKDKSYEIPDQMLFDIVDYYHSNFDILNLSNFNISNKINKLFRMISTEKLNKTNLLDIILSKNCKTILKYIQFFEKVQIKCQLCEFCFQYDCPKERNCCCQEFHNKLNDLEVINDVMSSYFVLINEKFIDNLSLDNRKDLEHILETYINIFEDYYPIAYVNLLSTYCTIYNVDIFTIIPNNYNHHEWLNKNMTFYLKNNFNYLTLGNCILSTIKNEYKNIVDEHLYRKILYVMNIRTLTNCEKFLLSSLIYSYCKHNFRN